MSLPSTIVERHHIVGGRGSASPFLESGDWVVRPYQLTNQIN